MPKCGLYSRKSVKNLPHTSKHLSYLNYLNTEHVFILLLLLLLYYYYYYINNIIISDALL